jgi:DNA-binding NtrC family response regulator
VSAVLVVQKDPAVSDKWSKSLERFGHAVISATTSAQAIKRLRNHRFDAVVIDATRASMRNLVSAMDELVERPPFVMVSSDSSAPADSARLGASQFLAKPCRPTDLLDAVDRITAKTALGTGRFTALELE